MDTIFICSANRDRSRTAEIHFQNKYPEHTFRSAGINKYHSEKHGGIYLQHYMLRVSDRIVCAEEVHKKWIKEKWGDVFDHKIEVLNLGDTDTFMTKSLIQRLEDRFKI